MPLHQRCATDVSLADVVVQLRRQVDILTQYLADLQPVASDTDSNVDDPDHRFVLSSPYTYDADHENDEFLDELSPCIPVDISPVFDEYPVELDGDDEYYSFLPRYDDESVSYEDHFKLNGVDDASYSSPPVYDEESMFFEGSFELDDKDATIDSYLQAMVTETYYRKRSKKAHQPSMEMDQCHQKGAAQGSVAASEPGQSPPPGRCATLLGRESHFLIPEGDAGDKAQMQNHIREGDLYEIDHSHLAPRTPAQLRSIRVAMLKLCELSRLSLLSYTHFGLLQEPSVVKALVSSIPPEPPPIALDSRSNLSNPGRDDVKQVEFKGVRILRVLNMKR